jgi:hypothetical protein
LKLDAQFYYFFSGGTNTFDIHISMTQLSWSDANWKLFASGTMLNACTDCDPGYMATGPVDRVLTAQYIKFTIKSHYGIYGGLSFFKPNSDVCDWYVSPTTVLK